MQKNKRRAKISNVRALVIGAEGVGGGPFFFSLSEE